MPLIGGREAGSVGVGWGCCISKLNDLGIVGRIRVRAPTLSLGTNQIIILGCLNPKQTFLKHLLIIL